MHRDPHGTPSTQFRVPGRDVLARVRGLVFAYGESGHRALDNVDLDVRAGEVLVLEGPSGGGKSTLLRALAGLIPDFHGGAVAGSVLIGEHDALQVTPAVLGGSVGIVFQDPEAQAVLGTVDRDVAFGPSNAGFSTVEILGRVDRALADAGVTHLAGRRIETLSSGERQRVAIAGVLARTPRIVLLDEPTSQLDAAAAEALVMTLRHLADRGAAVVVAEHRAERVRPIADRVLRVADGRIGDADPPAPVGTAPPAAPAMGPPAARAEMIRAGHGGRAVLSAASIALVPGRVTVLVGPNGSGKSTLLRVLAGLHRPDGGRVLLDDEDVSALPPERRFPRLGMLPQDPGRHLLTETVADEIGVALTSLGVTGDERDQCIAMIGAEMGLGDMMGRHPLDLSVGERERVALAAILVAAPGVLILDEPTRGMDPACKRALADLIRSRAAGGVAVLVATHDGPFAVAVADEVLEMRAGDAVPMSHPLTAPLTA
ncbi:MAG: ABC transporter ATP-binding protein [Thermoleophilia bacterium]|nr:ABC transporter ATP-binding protein [Thermoleophilia bacterium]